MAWLWPTYEQFVEYVQPVMLQSPGLFRLTTIDTWYETERRHAEAVRNLGAALQALVALGFKGSGQVMPTNDVSLLDDAHRTVLELVYAGEELLMLDSRLAKSRASYGFLHQHSIVDHWDRYSATNRIFREVDQLVKDTNELLDGLYELQKDNESFLVDQIDLPCELEEDFRLARNLFSIGFDDVGVLIAGRGFEGVLRRIAQVRKLSLRIKGTSFPAHDVDLHDLIELLFRVRWKKSGERLIAQDIRALLQYIRTLRNSGAHPKITSSRTSRSAREMATLIAHSANSLWKEVSSARGRFDTTVVDKSW